MSREPFSRAARDDFVAAPAAQRESRDPWHAACGAATDYVLNERDLAVTRTSAPAFALNVPGTSKITYNLPMRMSKTT